jgi:transposase, IS5 family
VQIIVYIYGKIFAPMIKYTPSSQLKIEEFRSVFELNLDKNNRWVILGSHIPWDELARIYYKKLEHKKGRASLDARIAIGAMIVKHKMNLSDRETVSTLQENPYIQFFLGLDTFHPEPLFDPSLFVELRKRMGHEQFDEFNKIVIEKSLEKAVHSKEKIENELEKEDSFYGQDAGNAPATEPGETEKPSGKLQIDATVADIYIKYPTDLDLLNTSREVSEQIIDLLHERMAALGIGDEKKPRTYRQVARKEYLSVSKKKKKGKKELRRAIKLQLNYLKRNFGNIEEMLDRIGGRSFPLTYKHQRYYWVIQEVYRQQREMFREKKNRCDDRIVSVHQPYVRPIVRGKSASPVEFGPKLGLTLDNGYTRINTFSWDAYHEASDLKESVEAYRQTHGHYPELVQADRIYATRENREWLKERGIRLTAKPLGRPKKKEEKTAGEKKKERLEKAERNHIEGKIGQGKNGYRMNQIRTRLRETAESWIACIVFVMNLVRMEKGWGRKGKPFFSLIGTGNIVHWFGHIFYRIIHMGQIQKYSCLHWKTI